MPYSGNKSNRPMDTKLLFRQQRVVKTRSRIKILENWFSREAKFDFPGRIVTNEFKIKKSVLSKLKDDLKELERDLQLYLYMKKFSKVCK